MGLELYSPDDDSAAVLTGILTPAGIDAVELRLALRNRYGITIAGGHGDVINRLFRIGHIGYVDVFDITTALGAIELQLVDDGRDCRARRSGCRCPGGVRGGALRCACSCASRSPMPGSSYSGRSSRSTTTR